MSDRKRYLGDRKVTKGRTRYLADRERSGERQRYTGKDTSTTVDLTPKHEEKKHHGGFLSTLEHVVTQTPKDLGNAALQAPGGLYAIGKATTLDFADQAHGKSGTRLLPLVEDMAKQSVKTLQHPLRHPGDTLLLGLPAVGQVAKFGEAGALAKSGASASKVAKAATVGTKPGIRTLKVGDMNVRGHYSRAAGARVVQKSTDRLLEKGPTMTGRKGVLVENALHRRAAKWEGRNQRTADAVARAPGTTVQTLGQKLKPHELRALRLVAEEVPVERRLGAQEMRKGRATNAKEQARHQERIDLTRKAMEHLTAGPDGKPAFRPEAHKLKAVYAAIQKASGDREGILKSLDLMDEQSLRAAKTNAARLAAGGHFLKPEEADTLLKETEKLLSDVESQSQKAADSIAATRKGTAQTRAGERGLERANARADTTLANGDLKAARAAAERANKTAAKASEVRGRHHADAEKAASVKGLLDRQERLATLTWERYQRGEVGQGVVARSHARLERLRDQYEKHATALVRYRQAEADGARAHAEQVRTAAETNAARAGNIQAAATIREEAAGKLRAAHVDQQKKLVALKDELKSLAQWRENLVVAHDRLHNERGRVIGADDVTVSPDAVHIGNPVERTKLRGVPKVSSTGTIGHTVKPSSLKTATGGSVEHALERNDVTNIVAERHAEAVRLGKVDRVVQKFKQAGETTPRRKDDVWMWTDKVVSNERIPKDVRKFLDNPEALSKLPEAQQTSLLDKIKEATFERHDWQGDAEAKASFEKLAQEGKGVFVPKRLLGEFAKRSYNVGEIPGVHVVDAINNAQKAGLVYLKLNYPVIQAASNTLMNAIQGAANPMHISRAVKLHHAIDAADRAITEDIMGQGAVLQAQFEGQGTVSRVTQKVAHVMSSKVDRPARLNAFYYEAIKAGFDTPAKYHALLTDDAHAGDLGEVAQRAREAIVDYGDMGPFERNVVRRLIFVYPWQKGAVKYAGHFLRDHPVQAAVLSQLGEVGKRRSDEQLGPVPSYLEGLIPVGDGRTVNPAGVNFFQTPAQIGTAAGGFLTGNPAQGSAGLGFLAPAPGIAAGLLSGRDDIGRPLTGNPAAKLRDMTVAQTPIAAAGRAAFGGNNVAAALLGHRRESQTFPDPNDPFARFFLGGLYPRKTNRGALNKNAARQSSGR